MAILLWTPAWSDPELEPEPEPKPKPKPNSSFNGLTFFHIIYMMSDNKLVEIAFNTAMLYGLWRVYWDIANPLTVQTVGCWHCSERCGFHWQKLSDLSFWRWPKVRPWRKKTWQSSRGLPSRLCQKPKRKNEAAWAKAKNWQNKTSLTPTTPSSSTTGCTKMSHSWTPVNQGFLTSTSPVLCKNKANWFLFASALLKSDTLPFDCYKISCSQC